jgi:hypothetical protein
MVPKQNYIKKAIYGRPCTSLLHKLYSLHLNNMIYVMYCTREEQLVNNIYVRNGMCVCVCVCMYVHVVLRREQKFVLILNNSIVKT